MLNLILLDSGKNAILDALSTQSTLIVNKYLIGSTANVTLDSAATAPSALIDPAGKYDGDGTDITYVKVNSSEIRFVLTLDEGDGDFTIGNFMLLLQDDTPFAHATLTTAVEKIKNNLPSSVGNRYSFNMTIGFTNISNAVDVSLLSADYATLPSVSNQNALPLAGLAPYESYILQNDVRTGRPSIVVKRNIDNNWFSIPTDYLDDTEGGNLTAGLLGKEYTNDIPDPSGYYIDSVIFSEDDGGYTEIVDEVVDFGGY